MKIFNTFKDKRLKETQIIRLKKFLYFYKYIFFIHTPYNLDKSYLELKKISSTNNLFLEKFSKNFLFNVFKNTKFAKLLPFCKGNLTLIGCNSMEDAKKLLLFLNKNDKFLLFLIYSDNTFFNKKTFEYLSNQTNNDLKLNYSLKNLIKKNITLTHNTSLKLFHLFNIKFPLIKKIK